VPAGSRACGTCGLEVTDPAAATVKVEALETADVLLAALRRDLGAEYDIEALVGHGGMGVVYRAQERELNRMVALKVLPLGTSPELAERFRREARVAANLNHPNIIPIHRIGQAAGTYFFTMRFVEGRALDAILESQGALSVPVTLLVLQNVLAGLAYAHDRRVIHRDIKGANVLIEHDGHVVLADLGIARALEDVASLTASGSVLGTPHYMSPEQCAGQRLGPQSDQYAVGVLAFQMLTGQVPFDAETIVGVLQQHMTAEPPELLALRDDVPPELAEIVRRALEKDPARRFDSTRGMLHAVEAVPFSEQERARAEEELRQLATGQPVPEVRTKSVPPARISGAPAVVAPLAPAPEPPAAEVPSPEPPPERVEAVAASVAEQPERISAAAPRPGAEQPVPSTAGPGVAKPGAASRSRALRYGIGGVVLAAGGGLLVMSLMRGGGSANVVVPDSVRTAVATDTAPRPAPLESPPGTPPADTAAPRVADTVAAAAPVEGNRGWIRLVGELPPEAVVWLNGRAVRGRVLAVTPDVHEIEVEAPDHESFTANVAVEPGDTTPVELRLVPVAVSARQAPPGRAYLSVIAVPPHAAVALDEQAVATGGLAEELIAAGRPVRLRITAPGYAPFDTTIVAVSGDNVRLGVRRLRAQP
jgi:hypothetical protein